MKITAIKQQVRREGRYSVFVDGKYSFSLSGDALLQSKLVLGQELGAGEVRELKQTSADDQLYNVTLRYIALRPRSRWELEQYLKRKKASPPLLDSILNKLSINGFLDDRRFAEAYVHDRRLLRPTSLRRLQLELRQKHVSTEVINDVLGEDEVPDQEVLQELIARKRKQTKYQDDLKLMQYLARQGFNYGDIKDALQSQLPED